jgi:hypothetical protein
MRSDEVQATFKKLRLPADDPSAGAAREILEGSGRAVAADHQGRGPEGAVNDRSAAHCTKRDPCDRDHIRMHPLPLLRLTKSDERPFGKTRPTRRSEVNYEVQNNMIRELTLNEVLAVSGGTKVCSYEVANRCYVWRDQSVWEQWTALVDFAVQNFVR